MSVPDGYDADDWGYEEELEEALPSPTRRKKPGRKNKSGRKKNAASGGTPSIGKRWFAVIGMVLGVVIAGWSVFALIGGNMRAIRGIATGGVIAAVSFGWFRRTDA